MRLHSLRVTAFGPFAGTESVDFDALGADGLFLLHGPTGAGKTTVLDAVAFALFGELPGARKEPDGRRLLSDHAAQGAAPRVELELTVAGQRVRLERSPEHQRAKKRGTGSTTEQAKVTLTWLDRPGSEGVTRIDEVAREVQRLLGMSADQFFQVVLLPQGEFARFLRAGTDERATLLQRLFDTGRFGDAEQWLAERRRSTAAVAESETQQVGVLVGQLCTASAFEGAAPSTGESLMWAQELAGSARTELDRVATELAAALRRTAAADADLALAREPLQLLARRGRAQEQLAALVAEEPRLAEVAAAVLSARRATPVAVAAQDALQCRATAERARAAVAELVAGVAADPDGAAALAAQDAGGADLAVTCDGWRKEVGRLAELVQLGNAVAEHRRRAQQLATREGQLSTERDALDLRRQQLPVRRAEADAALARAQRAADALTVLTHQLERAKEVASAAAQVPALRRAHAVAESGRSAAVIEHQRVREDWLDLRESRLAGMAAELAGDLRDGHACAVCGATEHPQPARPGEQAVGDDDERRARQVEQEAGAAVQGAAARTVTALRELDAAVQRSDGLDLEAADTALGEAERVCSAASVLAGTVSAARRRCTELDTATDELQLAERRCTLELASAQTEREGLEHRVTEAHDRLEDARGGDPDVTTRRARLDTLATTTAQLLAARADSEGAHRTAAQRAESAHKLAVGAGFAGVAQAHGAVLPEARVAALDAELAAARGSRSAAEGVLAEPEVAALGALDVDIAEAAVRGAQESARVAHDALGQVQGAVATARQRADALDRLLDQLHRRLTVLGPLLAEAERVAALADVVAGRGQNSRRVSLHSYVLAARLEQVALAASQRLRRMSGGRYEFVHSDAAGPRGTRGGLGLDVLDDHTGAVRSTKTLSGGESFLASLSLALGLADVVAEESGGVQLDTLFIDEGFGTLDPAALEEVMAVLDELRAGGRVVGLVSHVDELRQRIPSRLHVTMSRSGSHLEASTG